MPRNQIEIPGTEAPRIVEIEEAAEAYVKVRDRRMKLTEDEIATRQILIEAVNKHRKELTPNSEGELKYRYDDDMVVILKPGKERVKVKHDSEADTDDED